MKQQKYTTTDSALSSLAGLIYHDEACDWGHRDALINPKAKTVGIGAIKNKKKGTIDMAISISNN